MTIKDFEKFCNSLAGESGLIDYDIQIAVHADGCLGASVDGRLVMTEGKAWEEALDEIAATLRVKELA